MINIKSHIIITPKELRFLSADNDIVIYREPADDNFLKTIYKEFKISYPKFYKMDGMARLGFLGAEFLLKDENQTEDCTLLFIKNNFKSLNP